MAQTGFTLLLFLQREVLVHPAGAEELAAPSPPSWKVSFPKPQFPFSLDLPARDFSFASHFHVFFVGRICFQRTAELAFQSGVFLIQSFVTFPCVWMRSARPQMFPQFPQKSDFSGQIFVINLNQRFHIKHTFHLELASLFLPSQPDYSLFLSQSVNDTCVAKT